MRNSILLTSAILLGLGWIATPWADAQVLTARVFVLDEAGGKRVPPQAAPKAAADPGEVNVYDPGRDAAADIRQALAAARKQGKHVLLEVGGVWCIWCKILDRYFEDNPDLLALRKASYVMVKVNFSKENENIAVLQRYPKASGYPHFYVLDAQGALLKSQDTGELEEGRSYDHGRMRNFLKSNAPAKQ
ncbi:MAG: thioredoxin family protein [Bryobacterales bacterium]|nr:thioredoxin family protein [Bryobacterales bacterium]